MLIIVFAMKGAAHNEFALAGQTVSSAYLTSVTLYGDCVKMFQDFAPNWLLHHDNAPSHTSFRHFDTVEVIEAESQAVLNSLTEHNFQDALKKWQKRWGRCIRAEGAYFAMVVSRPKVSFFYQMAAPVPEIMDGSLYFQISCYDSISIVLARCV
jgi:hypothetical protein